MADAKLTIRIPRDLLEEAKRSASRNHTTLTRLVTDYLRRVTADDDPLAEAPIVRRLSGTLSRDASVDEYRAHLERKYGN